jgi:transcriptional regulator with XRE-family HTH domain
MAGESEASIDPVPARGDHADAPPVGRTIKRLRQAKGWSLQELALRSGVSAGMLSQIERDIANPSLKMLTRVRHALGVPLSALFEDSAGPRHDPDFVRRAPGRPKFDLGPQYLVKELLSSSVARTLQFMILHIPPGGGSGKEPLSYAAEKGGMVIEGEFLLKLGAAEVRLGEGDSFQFDGVTPHSFRNESERIARILWIIGETLPERHL